MTDADQPATEPEQLIFGASAPDAPPAGPMPNGRPPLRRATTNKRWLGVAEGLSRYLGISPGVLRWAFALSSLFGGLGLIAYLSAAVLIPREDEAGGFGERIAGGRSDVLLAVVAGSALMIYGILNSREFDLGIVGLLGAVGVILWSRSQGQWPWPAPIASDPQRGTFGAPTSQYAPWTATAVAPVPQRPRRSPRFGFAIVGLAIVAMIALAPFSSIWTVLIMGFAVLAIGLVAGLVTRQRIWFVWLPLLAIVPMLPAARWISNANVPLNAGVGEVTVGATEIGNARKLTFGHLTFEMGSERNNRVVTGAIGAGQLDVIVPARAKVVVHAQVGAGTIRVFGNDVEGTSVEVDRSIGAPNGDEGPTIELDLKVGMGLIDIRRSAA
jgi:phage shock protein PspC (stress-responsive transcriptional regulator)